MNTPLEYAFLSDDQKAADAEALVRMYASPRIRLMIRMFPRKYRRIAYIAAWERLNAAHQARRRLAAR